MAIKKLVRWPSPKPNWPRAKLFGGFHKLAPWMRLAGRSDTQTRCRSQSTKGWDTHARRDTRRLHSHGHGHGENVR